MSESPFDLLSTRIASLEARVKQLEGGFGYTCAWCNIGQPKGHYIYEIEKDGQWVSPCCALCARENKSRGPFPAMHSLK
jgi:hypothetical protein